MVLIRYRSKIAFITYINQDNTGVKVRNSNSHILHKLTISSPEWCMLAPAKPSRMLSTVLL